jgi:1-acyl-sn-glycerol-3-phosphate acyltransferase
MKVKPRKGGRYRRRAMTIGLYALGWLALTATFPVWFIGAFLVGLWRRKHFIILRLLSFGWFYLGLELVALVRIAAVFLLRRGEARNEALFGLQTWWAHLNLAVASSMLGLRFEVEGAEGATPGPSILLIRHASILDTLLTAVYVQRPTGFRVRYVVKQELLFDPCIDIVGNELPNYFVDRSGDTIAELEGIRDLVSDLGTEGVLIFPEGTRFSEEKRARALEKLEARGFPLCDEARAMSKVLPPKPGGVLTLLDALPDADCVFFAHVGLERFARIKNLLDGSVVGSDVRAKLWRVPCSNVPRGEHARLQWLYDEWSKVDAFVRNMLETK